MDPITEMFELAYAEAATEAFRRFIAEEDDDQPDELTENQDFAQDDDFHNMFADDEGFFTND